MIMGGSNQKFASPEEALKSLQHHGVKGMRWGVRKERDTSAVSGSLKAADGLGHGVAQLELTGKDTLTVNHRKGYTEFRPKGYPANPVVARRHDELIASLNETIAKYPAVANLKIEVVPMSRVPTSAGLITNTFAQIQGIKKGEARVIYNDVLGELEPHQTEFVKKMIPGMSTKGYLGQHEMGHLLAVAHGTFPPSHDVLAKRRTTVWDIAKFHKQNQKQHKELLKKHGLSFREVSKLSPYASTMPSEAVAELHGHYATPGMRSKLSPETQAKAEALFNELGGVE
jgi:hypothetical protein